MRLQFFGAVRTTTGSMHVVEANGKRVLLDCGLYQGQRKEAFERNRNLAVPVEDLDAASSPTRTSTTAATCRRSSRPAIKAPSTPRRPRATCARSC